MKLVEQQWNSRAKYVILGSFCVIVALFTKSSIPYFRGVISAQPKIHLVTVTFVALCVQAIPFILLGAVVSAAVTVWMTPDRWARLLPSNPVLGVVQAALLGMAVPSCECSAVPLARRMIQSGVSPSTAITFMAAAPSFNPVVLYSTSIAFGGSEMVVARWVAGLLATVGLGLMITFVGRGAFSDHLQTADKSLQLYQAKDLKTPVLFRWVQATSYDALSALTFIILGAGCTAIATAFMPREIIFNANQHLIIVVLVMAGLAMVMSLCSLGDAFIAASFAGLQPVGALTFLVVGPIIDLKSAAAMEGILGSVPTRFIAIVGLAMAVLSTLIVAWCWGWL